MAHTDKYAAEQLSQQRKEIDQFYMNPSQLAEIHLNLTCSFMTTYDLGSCISRWLKQTEQGTIKKPINYLIFSSSEFLPLAHSALNYFKSFSYSNKNIFLLIKIRTRCLSASLQCQEGQNISNLLEDETLGFNICCLPNAIKMTLSKPKDVKLSRCHDHENMRSEIVTS